MADEPARADGLGERAREGEGGRRCAVAAARRKSAGRVYPIFCVNG